MAAGATPVRYHEIGAAGAGRFHDAIAAAKTGTFAAAVTVKSVDEYKSIRTFLTPDGKAGFALDGDDLVSAFKHPDSTLKKFATSALALGVQLGARRLDCYDTVLPKIYSQSGFRAVARLAWDDKYAPPDWNKKTFEKFNGGRPDVVFMARDAKVSAYRAGEGVRVKDYDAGVAAQHAALGRKVAKAFNPDQPRVPAGSAEGGQFAGGEGGGDFKVGHRVAWAGDRGKLYLGTILEITGKRAIVEVMEHRRRGREMISKPVRYSVALDQLQLQKAFNPDQPREPAGGPGGGQWTSDGGEAGPSASSLLKKPTETADQIIAKVPGAVEAIAKARTNLSRSVPTSAPIERGGFVRPDGTYTPERAALQHGIIMHGKEGTAWKGFTEAQIEAATPAAGDKPTLYILGGRAGSGKSSFTKKDGPVDKSKAIYLNNDDLKEALPEYMGWNAANLHEESSHMGKLAETYARTRRLNLILDATMKGGHFDERIADFKKAGYRVEGYYMYVDPAEATKRTLTRFLEGGERGRYVPPEYSITALSNEKTFDHVKSSLDKWAIYDNNVPFGHKPKLVAGSK